MVNENENVEVEITTSEMEANLKELNGLKLEGRERENLYQKMPVLKNSEKKLKT